MFNNLQMQNKELQAETKDDSEQMPIVAHSAKMPQNPLLCDAFIEDLPHTDEKIIDKYTKQISTELYHLSKQFEAKGDKNAHVNARFEINKKYGKFWRERLNVKKIYSSKKTFGKMSYY